MLWAVPLAQQLVIEKKKTNNSSVPLRCATCENWTEEPCPGGPCEGPVGSSWRSASPSNDCAQSSVFHAVLPAGDAGGYAQEARLVCPESRSSWRFPVPRLSDRPEALGSPVSQQWFHRCCLRALLCARDASAWTQRQRLLPSRAWRDGLLDNRTWSYTHGVGKSWTQGSLGLLALEELLTHPWFLSGWVRRSQSAECWQKQMDKYSPLLLN